MLLVLVQAPDGGYWRRRAGGAPIGPKTSNRIVASEPIPQFRLSFGRGTSAGAAWMRVKPLHGPLPRLAATFYVIRKDSSNRAKMWRGPRVAVYVPFGKLLGRLRSMKMVGAGRRRPWSGVNAQDPVARPASGRSHDPRGSPPPDFLQGGEKKVAPDGWTAGGWPVSNRLFRRRSYSSSGSVEFHATTATCCHDDWSDDRRGELAEAAKRRRGLLWGNEGGRAGRETFCSGRPFRIMVEVGLAARAHILIIGRGDDRRGRESDAAGGQAKKTNRTRQDRVSRRDPAARNRRIVRRRWRGRAR